MLPPNTMVVFTSDHGDMLGDQQWLRKRNPYEPSVRVPMLMRFPNGVHPGPPRVVDEPVQLADVMPTLLDAVGMRSPETVEGRSVLSILRDSGPWREYVHGECAEVPTTGSGMHYLTDGLRKYVWLPGQGVEHFFDLQSDPEEMVDLRADSRYHGEVETWRGRLVHTLRDRPEGFTDGHKLAILGGPTPWTIQDRL